MLAISINNVYRSVLSLLLEHTVEILPVSLENVKQHVLPVRSPKIFLVAVLQNALKIWLPSKMISSMSVYQLVLLADLRSIQALNAKDSVLKDFSLTTQQEDA